MANRIWGEVQPRFAYAEGRNVFQMCAKRFLPGRTGQPEGESRLLAGGIRFVYPEPARNICCLSGRYAAPGWCHMQRPNDSTDGRTRPPPWAQRPDPDALAELPAAPGPTDADLLPRIAAGDRHAFEALYLRHWQEVLNFLRSRYPSLDVNTAEDIASETLLRIWQLRRGPRITRDVPGYLRRVASSVVADRRRRRTVTTDRKLPADVPSPLPSPDMAMERKELARQIGRALASLAQSHRFALQLTRQGLSAREIALQLGCTENAARQVIQKARKNLARALSRCGDSCAVDDGRPEQCPAGKENFHCLKYLYSSHLLRQ